MHNEGEALAALDAVFQAGFTNVSTDLLCGVPGQTVADLENHLLKLMRFPITHLSIYLLTLLPRHSMYKELPNEEEQLKHLLFIDEFMKSRGFTHYEISNFCKPGFQARHNMAYWTHESYLSFGPSAHSYSKPNSIRFKNFSSLHKYAECLIQEKKLPVEWTESLSENDQELEKWLLAIRLDRGFPRDWIQSSNKHEKLKVLIEKGYLETHPEFPDRLRATPRGFAISDALVRELA